MSKTGRFDIEPINATFGAVLRGERLVTLDDAGFEELYALWLEHALLVFPDQWMSNEEQVAFAKRFGKLAGAAAQNTNQEQDRARSLHRGNPIAWHETGSAPAVRWTLSSIR